MINDWYKDNTIDGQYAATCYREALGRVADQMRIYSDLPDELERGLRQAVAREGVLGTTDDDHSAVTLDRRPQAQRPDPARPR